MMHKTATIYSWQVRPTTPREVIFCNYRSMSDDELEAIMIFRHRAEQIIIEAEHDYRTDQLVYEWCLGANRRYKALVSNTFDNIVRWRYIRANPHVEHTVAPDGSAKFTHDDDAVHCLLSS